MDRQLTQSLFAPTIESDSDLEIYSHMLSLREQGYVNVQVINTKYRVALVLIDKLKTNHYGLVAANNGTISCRVIIGDTSISILIIPGQRGVEDVNANCSIYIAGNTTMYRLLQIMNSFDLQNISHDNHINITYFYLGGQGGTHRIEMSLNKEEISGIIPGLYPDIDIDILANDYKHAREPIMVLYGVPGVGKTSFIRHILYLNQYERIAYAKDPKVMKAGEFWAQLTDNSYDLIIFDDLDLDLAPREENEDNHFISHLLTLSDGIFTNNRTKIIITTNQKIRSIDSALIRPGRCFDFIQLDVLDNSQANDIWCNLLKMSQQNFDSSFGGATEISQALLVSEYRRVKNSTETRAYVKRGNKNYTIADKISDLGIASDAITNGTAFK